MYSVFYVHCPCRHKPNGYWACVSLNMFEAAANALALNWVDWTRTSVRVTNIADGRECEFKLSKEGYEVTYE